MDKMRLAGEMLKTAKELMAEFIGHYTMIGGKIYVDSNFINLTKGILSRSSLEHLGMGEFYLETPNGNVDFDRMRGKSFEGQVGRSHQLTDNVGGKLMKELIHKMTQKGLLEKI